MLDTILGCLKWAAVGFIVAFALMKLFEASHDIRVIHVRRHAFGIGLAPRAKAGLSLAEVKG